jgi:ankyrin repeat protein
VNDDPTQQLFAALANADLDAAQAALDQGASLSARNDVAMTPLTVAARDGRVDLVLFLLDRGAQVSHDTLFVASESADCPLSLLKLLQLAQIRQVTPQTDANAPADAHLLRAAHAGDRDALRAALDAGADPAASDAQDTSALRWAARHRHAHLVADLLDAGAGVNQASAAGWTALMEAVVAGDEDLVALLLDRGADVQARTTATAAVLYLAHDIQSFSPDPEAAARIVDRLAARGAPVVAPGWDG